MSVIPHMLPQQSRLSPSETPKRLLCWMVQQVLDFYFLFGPLEFQNEETNMRIVSGFLFFIYSKSHLTSFKSFSLNYNLVMNAWFQTIFLALFFDTAFFLSCLQIGGKKRFDY